MTEGPWSAQMGRWFRNRMPAEALPFALSCLVSGADVTLALHPTSTPSCSGNTLGVALMGCSRVAASAGARQPGSCQAPRHRSEVSQGWIPGRAAADRSLALFLRRASRLFPKGRTWAGILGGWGWGVEAKRAEERGPFSLEWQRLNWGMF